MSCIQYCLCWSWSISTITIPNTVHQYKSRCGTECYIYLIFQMKMFDKDDLKGGLKRWKKFHFCHQLHLGYLRARIRVFLEWIRSKKLSKPDQQLSKYNFISSTYPTPRNNSLTNANPPKIGKTPRKRTKMQEKLVNSVAIRPRELSKSLTQLSK